MLDVCITAIRRPETLDLTLRSFSKRLKHAPPFRIILNIDPLGDGSSADVIDCASQFSRHVCVRVAEQACFSSAVNWVWSNVRSETFLHLEDDWILKKELDYRAWERALRVSSADQLVLMMKSKRVDCSSLRYSFRPHLAKKKVISRIGPIPTNSNPEAFVGAQCSSSVTSDYGPYHCVEDIGRKWSKFQGLQKTGVLDSWFVTRRLSFWTSFEKKIYWLKWQALVRL